MTIPTHVSIFKYAVYIFCTCSLFFIHTYTAQAYTVSPLVIDLNVEKRELLTKTITLTNSGTRQVRIYPTVNEIALDEDGTIKTFQSPVEVDRTNTVTSWIEITRGRITLKPGETREIPLTVRVHPNVEAGEYHAFIGFPAASNKEEAMKRSMGGGAPGTVVRIAVDQERTEYLKLEGFGVDRFVVDPEKGTVNYSVLNTGEAPVMPRGEIIFYNTRGTEVATLPINPDGETVAEGDILALRSTLPSTLTIGKHKALLTLEYGERQTAALHDTAFFYMMPLKYMLMIFAAVLAFAILLTVLIYRRMSIPFEHDGVENVAMYIRQERSEPKPHDIDLKKNNNE